MRKHKAILIVGGSGLIGTRLALRLREGYKVFTTYKMHRFSMPGVSVFPLDTLNRENCKRIVYTCQPDVIVYAAGNDDSQWAEKNESDTERVHGGGTVNVLTAAEILQPKFIYLSNPYVFDGRRGNYREDDIVLPGGVLGKSKLSAENFVKGKSLNYVILRASPSYGRGSALTHGFLDKIRTSLSKGEMLTLPHHELHSFTHTDTLIEMITRLVDSGIRNKILHLGGLTKLSKYEFAVRFAKRFGFDSNLIRPEENPEENLDYSLNSTNAINLLKVNPLLLEQGFDLIEKRLVTHS